MDSQELGRRVVDRRKDMGLSQEALAQRAGISRNYISLIERGEARNVSLNIMGQLAIALETTPTWLMGQPSQEDILVSPALRKFGLEAGLSFETVDRLARIPRRGQEPQSVEEWQRLYRAIRPYLEEADLPGD
jgi:transcriptional regulator with XRE-family HTH domain